jgi:signal transduction histidine kinase
VAIVKDVTSQRNLEDALRRNERLACIGLLGAGIAHEISNPAGSALLAAETALAIKDDPLAAEQLGACLANIVASMDRCGRIVRTLLRYSRQEPTAKQACSINDVVVQALDQARPYADSQGVELRVELDADVPLAPMNPLEIELVLVNLLRNAVEAGSRGATVVVRTERTAGGARAMVRDEGRGMNEDQLAHVFDPLYTTRGECGGIGLGMSIAKKIVQSHQGGMEVRSRPGKGTTVCVELPATDISGRTPICTKNKPSASSTTTRKSANH